MAGWEYWFYGEQSAEVSLVTIRYVGCREEIVVKLS
jgi:hypothetical protein